MLSCASTFSPFFPVYFYTWNLCNFMEILNVPHGPLFCSGWILPNLMMCRYFSHEKRTAMGLSDFYLALNESILEKLTIFMYIYMNVICRGSEEMLQFYEEGDSMLQSSGNLFRWRAHSRRLPFSNAILHKKTHVIKVKTQNKMNSVKNGRKIRERLFDERRILDTCEKLPINR